MLAKKNRLQSNNEVNEHGHLHGTPLSPQAPTGPTGNPQTGAAGPAVERARCPSMSTAGEW